MDSLMICGPRLKNRFLRYERCFCAKGPFFSSPCAGHIIKRFSQEEIFQKSRDMASSAFISSGMVLPSMVVASRDMDAPASRLKARMFMPAPAV